MVCATFRSECLYWSLKMCRDPTHTVWVVVQDDTLYSYESGLVGIIVIVLTFRGVGSGVNPTYIVRGLLHTGSLIRPTARSRLVRAHSVFLPVG